MTNFKTAIQVDPLIAAVRKVSVEKINCNKKFSP